MVDQINELIKNKEGELKRVLLDLKLAKKLHMFGTENELRYVMNLLEKDLCDLNEMKQGIINEKI